LTGILILRFSGRDLGNPLPRAHWTMSFTEEALSCPATKFSMEPVKPLLIVIFLLSGWATYLHIVKWCI
jgi:hypothetical protein